MLPTHRIDRAKYGLAAARLILDTYGDDQGLGYDINCVFEGTLRRSSFGEEAERRNFQCIVDAFHCWAHKRTCQLSYHPLYKPQFGIDSLSTCEQIMLIDVQILSNFRPPFCLRRLRNGVTGSPYSSGCRNQIRMRCICSGKYRHVNTYAHKTKNT